MARNIFVFLKNIKFDYLNMLFFDSFDYNFIFFKKFNKVFPLKTRFVKIKKINFDKTCVNIVHF